MYLGSINLSRFPSPNKGCGVNALLRFALVRVGRAWLKGNAHKSVAFTAIRAMRDICTCVYHIVGRIIDPLPRLQNKGPQFAYQGQQVRFKI